MGYSNVDEDKFMYKYRWEVRASYDYDSSLFKKMQKAEDLIIKSNKLLKDSPIGEISYTEQADDIKKYKKQLNTIYDFIEEAYTKVISGIDEPLYEAFKNGPTSILGNLKAEDFETDNTLGLTQNESNGFRAGIYQKEKKKLTLEDFLTGNLNGDIEYYSMFGKLYREDCKNYGAFDRDASSYVGQYYSDAQLNYTGCVDEILTAGEYYHKKDNPWYVDFLKFEASVLIEPIYQAIVGKEIFSGEKLTDTERSVAGVRAMLDAGVMLNLGGAVLEESLLIGGKQVVTKTLSKKQMQEALEKAMEKRVISNEGPKTLNPYKLSKTHNQTLTKKEMIDLCEDIKSNGIKDTIKYVEYNGENYIVDGHHRVLAAKQLGLTEVPVEQVEIPYGGYKSIKDLLWID